MNKLEKAILHQIVIHYPITEEDAEYCYNETHSFGMVIGLAEDSLRTNKTMKTCLEDLWRNHR